MKALFVRCFLVICLRFPNISFQHEIDPQYPRIGFENNRGLQVGNDDGFEIRHERNPKEKSSDLSTSAICNPKDDGAYGSSTKNKIDVNYSYEMEVQRRLFNDGMSDAIMAVELAIIDSVAVSFFPWCKEIIEERQSEQGIGRSLQVQGMSPEPWDTLDSDAKCQNPSTERGSECALIKGSLTLFVGKQSSDLDMEKVSKDVHEILKRDFESHEYNELSEGVINIYFVSADLITFEEDELVDPDLPSEIQASPIPEIEDDGNPKKISYILIGSITAIAIAATFMIREKEKFKETEKEFEHGIFNVVYVNDTESDLGPMSSEEGMEVYVRTPFMEQDDDVEDEDVEQYQKGDDDEVEDNYDAFENDNAIEDNYEEFADHEIGSDYNHDLEEEKAEVRSSKYHMKL